ncbi:MAG: hypothetical protein ACI8ZT_000126, partial [Bacteroidia bacterium]
SAMHEAAVYHHRNISLTDFALAGDSRENSGLVVKEPPNCS